MLGGGKASSQHGVGVVVGRPLVVVVVVVVVVSPCARVAEARNTRRVEKRPNIFL